MSDSVTRYEDLFEADTHSVEFKLETLILRITDAIDGAMKQRRMSRADLARELDVSPPMVTKILNGTSNFTLRTLVNVSHALGCDFTATMAPCGHHVQVDFVPVAESLEGEVEAAFRALPLPSEPFVMWVSDMGVPTVSHGRQFYEYTVAADNGPEFRAEEMALGKVA
jgi:transcriptional regulator with XRE-family HTH domain